MLKSYVSMVEEKKRMEDEVNRLEVKLESIQKREILNLES